MAMAEAVSTFRSQRSGARGVAWDEEFAAFFQSEFSRVFRAAHLFCGNRESATDATQEAFVRAYERWGRLRRSPWLAGWVITTALNVCKRQATRTLREIPTESAPAGVGEDSSSGVGRIDLVRAIRGLPLRQRQAITLFYLTDYSSAEIAHLLGISEGAVKKHLGRARASLRDAPEIGVKPNE